MKSPLLAAIMSALARIVSAAIFGYVALGCIIFPTWWKEFLFNGGVFKGFIWRDACGYLEGQIIQFSPLAVSLLVGFLLLFGFIIFWLGKHSAESEGIRAAFFQKMPPSKLTVAVLGVFCLILSIAASLQPGSYSQGKANDLLTQILSERLKELGTWDAGSPFLPPQTGVYLYLNENLVIKQFEALQDDLVLKETSESTLNEKSVAASVTTPGGAAGINAGNRASKEETVTRASPEISANFVAGRLIKRFGSDTNTFKWSYVSPFGGSSEFLSQLIESRGVRLTSEQKAQLKASDKSAYEQNVEKLIPQKVLFFYGNVRLRKMEDGLYVEFSDNGPVKVLARGRLQKKYLDDAMLFAFEGKDQSREMAEVKVFAIVEYKKNDAAGNVEIAITPYAIW